MFIQQQPIISTTKKQQNNYILRHIFLVSIILIANLNQLNGMRVDPERIAARLRIEEEIEMDKLEKAGRNRRELSPKEQTIHVSN